MSWDRPSPLEAAVAASLTAAVDRHGSALLANPKRLDDWLVTSCPDGRAEIAAILAGLSAQVPQSMMAADADDDAALALPSLVDRLANAAGLERPRARWVVRAWARAIAVSTKGLDVDGDVPHAPAARIDHRDSVATVLGFSAATRPRPVVPSPGDPVERPASGRDARHDAATPSPSVAIEPATATLRPDPAAIPPASTSATAAAKTGDPSPVGGAGASAPDPRGASVEPDEASHGLDRRGHEPMAASLDDAHAATSATDADAPTADASNADAPTADASNADGSAEVPASLEAPASVVASPAVDATTPPAETDATTAHAEFDAQMVVDPSIAPDAAPSPADAAPVLARSVATPPGVAPPTPTPSVSTASPSPTSVTSTPTSSSTPPTPPTPPIPPMTAARVPHPLPSAAGAGRPAPRRRNVAVMVGGAVLVVVIVAGWVARHAGTLASDRAMAAAKTSTPVAPAPSPAASPAVSPAASPAVSPTASPAAASSSVPAAPPGAPPVTAPEPSTPPPPPVATTAAADASPADGPPAARSDGPVAPPIADASPAVERPSGPAPGTPTVTPTPAPATKPDVQVASTAAARTPVPRRAPPPAVATAASGTPSPTASTTPPSKAAAAACTRSDCGSVVASRIAPNDPHAFEMTIRMDDRSIRTLVQPLPLRTGLRVRRTGGDRYVPVGAP